MTKAKDKDETENKNEDKKDKGKKTLSLGGTLSLKGGSPKSSGSSSSGVSVAVVGRKRSTSTTTSKTSDSTNKSSDKLRNLTDSEREARMEALKKAEEDAKSNKDKPAKKNETATVVKRVEEESAARKKEMEELERIKKEEAEKQAQAAALDNKFTKPDNKDTDRDEESYRDKLKRQQQNTKKPTSDRRRGGSGKLTVTQVLNKDYDRDRGPSIAAQRRAREKARMAAQQDQGPKEKVVREVVVPEAITVQELANRMAEPSGEVVKKLMGMGVMATINQAIDADTAELIIDEFGHKIKRVSEADVEEGIEGPQDDEKNLKPRPPVVTIMGHVDHGKTSLLDALRETDVVAGEAGGITQHIGAYQVTLETGDKVTFLDTPGHAAFTEMRSRGANITDIVVLVVAANDSIMPQTIEAISHAKAAEVPLIVAVNKVDLPDADPNKVKTDLLQHEVVVEDMGGDVLCIEVSAKQRQNLDKLVEGILLQAEILETKANPDRTAVGTVVEAKLEQGRGNVATVLVEFGTLKNGDIFVVGSESGRVRAMIDDKGNTVDAAIPGQPVEVLGLNGAPEAGDRFVVVENENKARQITEYRNKKRRDMAAAGAASFEELMTQANAEKVEELNVVIKADVHGSVEALIGSLQKIEEENEGLAIKVLHTGVGGISETDVSLAKASNAIIIGFNVRANSQARELSERESVDIRYYNIIYNVIDDIKAVLGGLLDPIKREQYLGQAEIREVFNITKVGKVAGCMVTKGEVQRGAGVRLLRDDVVIHEGTLKTLKRFKDEVKDVKEGMECGMAFEKYDDIKSGDIIECYEIVEEARTVE